MGLGEVIKQARLTAGLSQDALGIAVGVTGQSVGQWESGKTLPKGAHALKLIDILGIDAAELLASDPVVALEAGVTYYPRPTHSTAPLYASIAAGIPMEQIERAGEIPVPETILSEHPKGFFLKVSGESMNRVLPDGCYAFVDPDADVMNGDVTALMVNSCDATIKRFHRMATSVVLQPDSCDPAFADMILDYSKPDTDTVTLIGRVVWFVAPYGERL